MAGDLTIMSTANCSHTITTMARISITTGMACIRTNTDTAIRTGTVTVRDIRLSMVMDTRLIAPAMRAVRRRDTRITPKANAGVAARGAENRMGSRGGSRELAAY